MFKFNVINFFKKEKITENTRICFDCDNHYTPYKNELPFLYCPYCGKQTYGFDNESLERFDKNYSYILKNDLKENQGYLKLIDKLFYSSKIKYKDDLYEIYSIFPVEFDNDIPLKFYIQLVHKDNKLLNLQLTIDEIEKEFIIIN